MHDHSSDRPGTARRRGSEWNLHRLRIFWTVARHLSFTRAAQELFVAQPAVSHQVKALERELGVVLFERAGRTIALTDAGRVLAASCDEIFAQLEESATLLSDLREGAHGWVDIAADTTSGTYVVPPALGAFHRTYPAIEITLHVENRAGVQRRLTERACDLAVMASPPREVGCEVTPFLPDRLVVVAAPDHPLVGVPGIVPEALARIEPGDVIVVDGDNAQVMVRPGDDVQPARVQKLADRLFVGLPFQPGGLGQVFPHRRLQLHLELLPGGTRDLVCNVIIPI